MRRAGVVVAAAGWCIWASATNAAVPDLEPVRQEFTLALQRARARLPDLTDSPALEAYVLHDYLTAARLRREVGAGGSNADAAVDDFLRSHAGQPVGRSLRREWLASLAARARWDWFLPRSADATEAPLVCDRLAGRLAVGDTVGLAAEALARWNTPQRQPSECNAVFSWLRAQGQLSPALTRARVRAALAANDARLARDFMADLPAPRPPELTEWLQLLEEPKPALSALAANPALPVEADALVAGFTRLSSSDATAASALLSPLSGRADVSPSVRARLQRAAALGLAYSRAPGAVAAFSAVPSDAADVPLQEWRVRAALWQHDFSKALQWLDEMPPALATQPRWRYWRARAVEATLGHEPAVLLYAAIAATRDYYGYLAADRLKQSYTLNIRASPDDAPLQAMLAAEPALQRAQELFACELADDAAAEWASVVGTATPALKVQAAHLSSRWGWYAQTIATLAQAGEWDDVPLRYPRPYAALIEEAGRNSRVPADWLFGIMRQESLFRKDAVSRADARGLMQMLPSTATLVARRAHLPLPSREMLFDPSVAIPLGAAYVRELLDKYGGQLDQTLAAYNAGPGAVARWLPPETVEADIWIENIPYTETRGYVQHIVEHIVAFASVRNEEPPRLAVLLPPVEPAGMPVAPP